MKKIKVVLHTKEDLSVDLTIHDFAAFLLTEFAEKIVRPYYSANMSEALKDLMRNAIREEDFVLDHIRAGERGDHG
jgi:hypothetical protein